MRRFAVLLAALATFVLLVLLPSASAKPSSSKDRCLAEVFWAVNPTPRPGDTVKFIMKLMPTHVDTLSVSVTQLQWMQLLRKGSAPYQIVEGRPTWTRHNLSGESYLRFSAKVSLNAPRGHRMVVLLHTVAQTATCNDVADAFLPLHVSKR